ncbi:MAG: histone deacetylase [bacterium]|nr:histone deacetylase [bacterium]
MMKAFYVTDFVLPLPPDHRFPMSKYSGLYQRVKETGIAELIVPPSATDEQILRCHTADYLHRLVQGQLTPAEIRRIGFPWSDMMVERCRRSSGATIVAGYAALTDGVAVNLAGGTHHACTDHGEGFCVFNDAAIAARELQACAGIKRVLIVDCDVHQGNGTAQITHNDPTIFTFSIHGEKNFPHRKFAGNLDIGLDDGTTDDDYLAYLEEGLHRAIFLSDPDFAIYISGADPFVGDKLGKLNLTKEGLANRDRLVMKMLREANLPVAVAMGGGYAPNIADIVDIHYQTVLIASQFAQKKDS